MVNDFWIVVRWWGVLFLVGAAAFPLTRRLFRYWWDEGYLFSKAVGMAVVSWIVYVLGTLRLAPFSFESIFVAISLVFLGGVFLNKGNKGNRGRKIALFIAEEVFFFAALLFWAWIKAHEPSIRGLEKFMDFGFMKSILNSSYFPPADMWYAGEPINYYYFGHLVTAVLTKLSGIDLAYAFNLMLATLFALTLTMSFSIGYQIRRMACGFLTAFLVTLAGNMQTLYAFTKGYVGDNVQPFWKLLGEANLAGYWYANATRFIPFTIHEFPGYSFVVSDVHGHVLAIPFALLAIALLITSRLSLIFYGFIVGVLIMTNALDGLIYFVLALIILQKNNVKNIVIIFVAATITSLPFLTHFKSFVSGIAVNCPPAFLANTKIGPLIFEGVEKCQRSPIWMLLILWGFFLYCGGWIVRKNKLLTIFYLFSVVLIIFPEFFYFKDIYPAHFRSNTMFKLGYQAFILFSIVSGYAIVSLFKKRLFLILLLPQLFLVSIYPIFSIRSYFGELKKYEGIEGLGWIRREYLDDFKAIQWLNKQPVGVLVEADGDSYTDYARFSAFTGMPTIVGWPVHEWLWRGSYDVVSPRREEVRKIYESRDLEETKNLITKYNVRYVVVGSLEQIKFANLQEWKFAVLGKRSFESGETVVWVLTREGKGG